MGGKRPGRGGGARSKPSPQILTTQERHALERTLSPGVPFPFSHRCRPVKGVKHLVAEIIGAFSMRGVGVARCRCGAAYYFDSRVVLGIRPAC